MALKIDNTKRTDVWLCDVYVAEMPKESGMWVDYREIVFHIPMICRDTFDYKGELSEDQYRRYLSAKVCRHYIEKRGHPGREKELLVYIVTRDEDGKQHVFSTRDLTG